MYVNNDTNLFQHIGLTFLRAEIVFFPSTALLLTACVCGNAWDTGSGLSVLYKRITSKKCWCIASGCGYSCFCVHSCMSASVGVCEVWISLCQGFKVVHIEEEGMYSLMLKLEPAAFAELNHWRIRFEPVGFSHRVKVSNPLTCCSALTQCHCPKTLLCWRLALTPSRLSHLPLSLKNVF